MTLDGAGITNYGTLTVTGGGTITSTLTYTISSSSIFTMNSGTIIGGDFGLKNSGGTINVSGGTVSGTSEECISNYNSIVMIGSLSNAVNNTSPVIIGNTYGYSGSGTLNFYNGIIKGRTSSIYNSSSTINYRSGYNITNGTETIGGSIYNTTYLVAQ